VVHVAGSRDEPEPHVAGSPVCSAAVVICGYYALEAMPLTAAACTRLPVNLRKFTARSAGRPLAGMLSFVSAPWLCILRLATHR
jgi:hypothetical protein